MHHSLLAALLLAAPCCGAQEAPRPDQPEAAVPETRYTPPAARAPEAPATTPDRHWVEANRTVRSYNPMMLTMPERPKPTEQEHGAKEHH